MEGGFFFFNDTATTEIYTLSLHDALPICRDHPATGLRSRSSPDVGSQSRSHHTEMEGVGDTGASGKWHTCQNSRRPGHPFLNDQTGPIDKRLVPVIAIGPAQHITKVAVAKGAQRAGHVHLSVRSCRPDRKSTPLNSSHLVISYAACYLENDAAVG